MISEHGEPAIERFTLKAGTWLAGRWYVADVSGGTAVLLTLSLDHGREQIEQEGKRIRAARRAVASRRQLTR